MDKQFTEAIDLMKTAHEDLKKTNEQMIELKSEHKSIVTLEEKMGRIQDDLDAIEAKYEKMKEEKAKAITEENLQIEAEEIKKWIFEKNAPKSRITLLGTDYKAMNTEINTDGGYWIKPSYSNRIIRNIEETSPLRMVATVEKVAPGTTELLCYREMDEAETAGWVTERAARSETATPETGLVRIPLHQIYADPKLSTKVINNPSFNFERWTKTKVTDKIARTQNTAFISGTGVGQPEGILNNATIVANTLTSATSGVVDFDDLIKVQTNIKDVYARNAAWAFKRLSMRELRLIVDGNGNYIWQPSGKDGVPATLLGDKYILMDDIPVITNSAKAILYGDFAAGYTIVDGSGLSILRDPYSTKGFVELYFEAEVGGAVVQPEALQLLTVKA